MKKSRRNKAREMQEKKEIKKKAGKPYTFAFISMHFVRRQNSTNFII
jgi:hypothetical protein